MNIFQEKVKDLVNEKDVHDHAYKLVRDLVVLVR